MHAIIFVIPYKYESFLYISYGLSPDCLLHCPLLYDVPMYIEHVYLFWVITIAMVCVQIYMLHAHLWSVCVTFMCLVTGHVKLSCFLFWV